MAWYDFLTSWRADAPAMPVSVRLLDDQPIDKLFRADSFENTMTGLGGPNDMAMAHTIRRPRGLSLGELDTLYRTNGYVKRFIDIVPDQATRKGWQVIRHADPDANEADEQILEDDEKRLSINANIGDALRWARLYGGSIILMVNEDEDLSEPMDEDNPGEIINLAVFDRCELAPMTWNDDLASPHFREVETWSLSPSLASTRFAGGEVHRSRVIYFPGTKVPPSKKVERNGFDDSIIECAYDQIVNKSVLDQQMARLSHDSRTRVLKLRGLTGKGLSDAKEALLARAKLWAQTVGLIGVGLLLEGEEFVSQTDNVTGWAQLDDKARQALSAVTGIPQTLLFGDSPSGLNTDGQSGRNNFGDLVVAVQNHLLRPQLERLYSILLASHNQTDLDWSLEFEPIFEVTEKETADIRKVYAEIDTLYTTMDAYTAEDVANSRFSVRGWENDIRAVDMDDVADREALLEAELDLKKPDDPTEEEEIKKVVEIPDAPNKAPEEENIQATTFTPAQQQAVQGWISLFVDGKIPRQTAVEALVNMSQLDKAIAELMVPPSTFRPAVDEPDTAADPNAAE